MDVQWLRGNNAHGDSASLSCLVVFTVGDHFYALPVERVEEVICAVAITPVVDGPQWLRGFIVVRGRITPVADLRARLGLASTTLTLDTRIVLAESNKRSVGLMVDAANEVLSVPTGLAEPAGDPQHLSAVIPLEDRLITILNIDQLLKGWPESRLHPDGK